MLLDFVEGRMSALDFEQKVYNDSTLESLLRDDSLHWHDTYIKTNPYEYLINLNYHDPAGVLNAQGAVGSFLNKRRIPFESASVYSEFYNLLLGLQPKWVNVESTYLKEHILPDAGDRNGKELKEWLKARLCELFRFHKRPPKWIQNPTWPINENGPMYFLGQFKVENCELFHDTGAVYVFLDTKTGVTKTVIQLF
jgi:hypothetical protein